MNSEKQQQQQRVSSVYEGEKKNIATFSERENFHLLQRTQSFPMFPERFSLAFPLSSHRWRSMTANPHHTNHYPYARFLSLTADNDGISHAASEWEAAKGRKSQQPRPALSLSHSWNQISKFAILSVFRDTPTRSDGLLLRSFVTNLQLILFVQWLWFSLARTAKAEKENISSEIKMWNDWWIAQRRRKKKKNLYKNMRNKRL